MLKSDHLQPCQAEIMINPTKSSKGTHFTNINTCLINVFLKSCSSVCVCVLGIQDGKGGGFKLNKIEGQRVREDTEGEERQENYCRRVLSYPQHSL